MLAFTYKEITEHKWDNANIQHSPYHTNLDALVGTPEKPASVKLPHVKEWVQEVINAKKGDGTPAQGILASWSPVATLNYYLVSLPTRHKHPCSGNG